MLCAERNDGEGADDIQPCHKRDQQHRDPGDGADTPDNDQRYYRGQSQAEKPSPLVQPAVLTTGDHQKLGIGLVGLKHVADTKARYHQGEGIESAHQAANPGPVFALEPVLQVVHGSTGNAAVGILAAVLDPEGTLHEFGGHRKYAGNQQPEGRTGSPHADRHGDATDVAHTHGAGHRRCNRFEVADLPLCLGVAEVSPNVANGQPQGAEIYKAQVDGEIQCCCCQPQHDQG